MKKMILLPILNSDNKLMQTIQPYIDDICNKAKSNGDEVLIFDVVLFTQDAYFRRDIVTQVLDKLMQGYIIYTNMPRVYFDPVMKYGNQIKNIYEYKCDE
jgi:predicted nucleic-acid-binding protein